MTKTHCIDLIILRSAATPDECRRLSLIVGDKEPLLLTETPVPPQETKGHVYKVGAHTLECLEALSQKIIVVDKKEIHTTFFLCNGSVVFRCHGNGGYDDVPLFGAPDAPETEPDLVRLLLFGAKTSRQDEAPKPSANNAEPIDEEALAHSPMIAMDNPFGPKTRLKALHAEGSSREETADLKRICDEDASYFGVLGTLFHQKMPDLIKRYPNMAEIIERIGQYCAVRAERQLPAWFPPLLLVGPPGVGKTECIYAIANALGVPHPYFLCGGNVSGALPLTGSDPSWRRSGPGLLVKTIAATRIVNPIVVLDEIDKAPVGGHYGITSVHDYLLSALERTSARRMADEHLTASFPFNASHTMWVAMANDVTKLPGALLDRFQIHNVRACTPAEMRGVVTTIVERIIADLGDTTKDTIALDEPVMEKLSRHTPREVRKMLEPAIITALYTHAAHISLDDLTRGEQETRRIGF